MSSKQDTYRCTVSILFIQPIISIGLPYPVATDNLALYILANQLEKYLSDINFRIFFDTRNEYKKIIRDEEPDLCCISSTSPFINKARECAEYAKSLGIPSVLGGPHITVMPDSFPPEFEVGCIGEGEFVIVDLVKSFLENKHTFRKNVLSKIPGIVYYEKEKLVKTKARNEAIKLDDTASPYTRYLTPRNRTIHYVSSRGCPFKCVFCAATKAHENLRFLSAEYIINDLEQISNKFKLAGVRFLDENFLVSKKRCENIARLKNKSKRLKAIKLFCATTSKQITRNSVELLKSLNVRSVGIGFESGSPRILNYLKYGAVTIDDHIRAIALLSKNNIKIIGSFIIGSPSETVDEIEMTYRFIKENPISMFNVFMLQPLPGTPLWEQLTKEGQITKEFDFDMLNLNNYDTSLKINKVIPSDQLKKIYQRFQKLSTTRAILNVPFHPIYNRLMYFDILERGKMFLVGLRKNQL